MTHSSCLQGKVAEAPSFEKEILIWRTSIAVGPYVKNQPEQKQAKRKGKPLVPKGKVAEAPSFEKEREYFQKVDAFELLEESPSPKNFGTWATGNQTLTDPIPHVSSRLEKWLFSKKLNFNFGPSSTLSKILETPAAQMDSIYSDGLDFSSLRTPEKCNPISGSDVHEGCEDVNAAIRKLSLASTSSDLDPIDPFSALLEICKQPAPSKFLDLFSKYWLVSIELIFSFSSTSKLHISYFCGLACKRRVSLVAMVRLCTSDFTQIPQYRNLLL